MRDIMSRSRDLPAFRQAVVVAVLILSAYSVCLAIFQSVPQALLTVQTVFGCALATLVAAACMWAARQSLRMAPQLGPPWTLMATGMLCVVATAAIDLPPALQMLPRGAIFSVADVGRVMFYILFITAMLMMPREMLDRARWLSILLDVVTLSIAGIVLLWSFVFIPAIADDALRQPFSARSHDLLLMLLYPALGLMLLWTSVMILLQRPVGVPRLTIGLLFAGSVLAMVSDVLLEARSVLSPFAVVAPAPTAEAVWFVGCLLLGLAAMAHVDTLPATVAIQKEHRAPSQERPSPPISAGKMAGLRRKWARYLPLAWTIFAYLLLTWSAYFAAGITMPVPFTVSVLGVSVLFGLVLLRQLATTTENIDLAERLRNELAERRIAEELLYLNQERMKHLLSATPAVIYAASAAEQNGRRLTFVSDNVRVILGHAPGAFTTDQRFWLACVHPDDRPDLLERLRRPGGGESFVHEYRFRTSAGLYRWVRDEARLIRDNTGQPVEVVGFWADITERKRMEQALRQANDELELRVQARTAELSQTLEELRREINERQQAEASLRESEAKFRSFVEQSTDCLLLTDEQGNIVEWNRSFEALTGLPRERAIGRKVWDAQWEMIPEELQTADRRARIEQVFKQALWAGEQPFSGRLTEGRIQSLDGTRRIVQQRAFPICTKRGICVGAVLRDVTPQKEAEQRLRDSEARYRAISELISDFAFAVRVAPDNTATLEWVTDGFNRIAGGHLSANGLDMLKWVEPEDRPNVLNRIRAALSSRRATTFETRIRSGTGRQHWIEGTLLAQRDTVQGVRLICAGQDITARKQAEARERQYTENLQALSRTAMAFLELPIGADIYRLIADQLYALIGEPAAVAATSFDAATSRLTVCTVAGLDRFAALNGLNVPVNVQDIQVTLGQDDIARLAKGHLARLDVSRIDLALRHVLPATRASLLDLISDCAMYSMGFSGNGQLFGSIAILLPKGRHLDNARLIETFVRQTTVALQRQQVETQLQASLREKEAMLQEIHHRVKNNLQVVSSLLNLQAERAQDPALADILRDSQNRVRSMAYIHERLYRFADLAQVDFAEYTRALADHLLNSYQSKDQGTVDVHVEIGPDVRLGVDTAIPCGLIVNELVSNALKHAFPPGWKRPGLVTIAVQQTPNGYMLKVQDNGVGLPADVDVRCARSLGLELVTILAQQLGGALEIDRQGGTAFTITFGRRS